MVLLASSEEQAITILLLSCILLNVFNSIDTSEKNAYLHVSIFQQMNYFAISFPSINL